jgi:hypothetical protein
MKFKTTLLLVIAIIIVSGILMTACDNRILDPDDNDSAEDKYILTIWAEPDTIYADDDNATYSTIYVKVKDLDDFLIPEQRVNFGTNLGDIIAYDVTDSSGVATVEFWDDGIPGVATISANTDHIDIDEDGNEITTTISANMSVAVITQGGGTSTDVQSIGFDFSGQVNVPVGGSSINVVVNLYDINGNLIQEPKDVYFQFVNAPIGTSINSQIFWPSEDSLSVVSTGGQASIPITSGFESGTASLRAFTFNNSGDKISAVKSEIVISSGPPNSVSVSIGGQDSGEDMGSGIWKIECAAFLTDQYNNPVDYGTAVYFSLNDTVSFASIYAPAYVGNENSEGDSTSGIAYTYLNFDGTHTNDPVQVNVEVSNDIPGMENFTDSQIVILPIQQASIEIIAIPAHIDWTATNNPEWQSDNYAESPKIRVIVRDGQENLIKNQEVTFTSSLGLPVHENQLNMQPTNPAFEPDYIDYTGPDNDGEPQSETDINNGEIIQLFRFYKYECPIPPVPNTVQVSVSATIVGTNESDTTQLTLTRYVE